MQKKYNEFPDIEFYDVNNNPTIYSPSACHEISFYQTRSTLNDVELYKRFLDNVISVFRHSVTYKNVKGWLLSIGLDRCQFHSNITSEMASIEMHHNMLTVFDLALIITEHIINTRGMVCTNDVIQLLKEEHKKNHVQLVMLSLTPHQLYHNTENFFIHPDMCFGDWYTFLDTYNKGITKEIAFKIIFYLKRAIEEGCSNDGDLLNIRKNILNWSELNECYR